MRHANRLGGWFGTGLFALALAMGTGCSSGGSEDDDEREICDNGIDDDGDGDTDCDDAACSTHTACIGGGENCDNGTDDDGDGDADCDDSDCAGDPACTGGAEVCDNGTDDDGDGDADCDDSDCAGDPACEVACLADADYGDATLTNQAILANDLPNAMAVIGDLNADPDAILIEMYNGFGAFADGIDRGTYTLGGDDLNYATCGLCVRLFTEDTDDAGYFATSGTITITALNPVQVVLDDVTFEHVEIDGTTFESTPHPDGCTSYVGSASFDVEPPPSEICDNDADDDGDGDVDCDDADCAADPACAPVEICDNDVDDDGDGDIDCDDADCSGDPACPGPSEICVNGIDDDGDGDIDCDDADCAGAPACSVCTADASYGDATVTGQFVVGNALPNALAVAGELNADVDGLQVELYNGFGVFTGGIAPGSYTLGGDELNYMTCGLCVRLFTEAGDDGYLATGGTVEVTQVDPFIGTLTDVTFEHVNIDGTTFESTPHPDGCTSAVDSASFDLTPETMCDDGVDNDGDGATDCDDTDCAVDPACVVCGADADYGDATLSNQAAETDGANYAAFGELNGDVDGVFVQLFDNFGVFTDGVAPGTYTIAGDELNYATCGLCVFVVDEAEEPYLATGGTVVVTEVSPDLVMDLSGMTFEHVTIDETTAESTPHPDACTSAVNSASFDVTPTTL